MTVNTVKIRGMVLGVLLAAGVLSVTIAGYQGPPTGGARGTGGGRGAAGQGAGQAGGRGPAGLQTTKVADNLYMIAGAGGNTAAFVMATGVLLVDTKNPNNGQGILDQVKTVTDKPITMVINTHTHADHTGSNEFFTDKVEFVAQSNTKANMQKMPNFAGDKAKFLPSRTYSDIMTIGSGADQVILYYFGRAHTSGDTFVVFPAARVMHSGDAFASKSTPIIDTANGGSAVDYGKTLAKVASTVKNVDRIITGHLAGAPVPFSDLQTYADFNNEFVTWVQDQIKAGKTADQAAAEFKMPEKYTAMGYTPPGTFLGGVAGNIRTAYTELGK